MSIKDNSFLLDIKQIDKVYCVLGLHHKFDVAITDTRNECSCKLGLKISFKKGTVDGVAGNYYLIRHYNYNNKPVYYNPGLSLNKALHLYFGNINGIPGKEKGWMIQHEFGYLRDSLPLLFHDTDDITKCPEAVGLKWYTKKNSELQDVEIRCM